MGWMGGFMLGLGTLAAGIASEDGEWEVFGIGVFAVAFGALLSVAGYQAAEKSMKQN